jgi:hypothetical protein
MGRRAVAVALIAVAICTGVVAGASGFWSGSGSGSTTTSLANSQSLSFEPGVPTSQLYPGGDVNVAILASNPNDFFVHVSSMILDVEDEEPFEVDAGHTGCDLAALSFTTQNNDGAGWEIPPRAGTTDGVLEIDMAAAMAMSEDGGNACQGAIFSVHLEAKE